MPDEYSLEMAKDMGALQADMRTVKHDLITVSTKIDALSNLITKVNTQQARGLGFFAGIAFIVGGAFTLFIAVAKLLFAPHT